MLQDTFLRLDKDIAESINVVCNAEHKFLVLEECKNHININKLILEPEGRNTAPAMISAALAFNPEDIIIVLSADHFIKDTKAFNQALRDAIKIAEKGKIVTFGIKPTTPHTGYGYIECGEKFGKSFAVQRFTEKPNPDKAIEFFKKDSFLWNSGMFVFRVKDFLKEAEKFRPTLLTHCKKALPEDYSESFIINLVHEEFKKCKKESIDHAVMENTKLAVVYPIDIGWSDIGSWQSLWSNLKKDDLENHIKGDVIIQDVKKSYIRSDSRLVAALGVEGLSIIETPDAVLVTTLDKSEDLRLINEHLENFDRKEKDLHSKVRKPWGSYSSLLKGDGFQVKRIIVQPDQKLSIQKHKYRSEHWIIIKGIATVLRGEDSFTLGVNESIYIEKEQIHSLQNLHTEVLEIIEVQVGSYLGEDDIERIEDIYGRI